MLDLQKIAFFSPPVVMHRRIAFCLSLHLSVCHRTKSHLKKSVEKNFTCDLEAKVHMSQGQSHMTMSSCLKKKESFILKKKNLVSPKATRTTFLITAEETQACGSKLVLFPLVQTFCRSKLIPSFILNNETAELFSVKVNLFIKIFSTKCRVLRFIA